MIKKYVTGKSFQNIIVYLLIYEVYCTIFFPILARYPDLSRYLGPYQRIEQ